MGEIFQQAISLTSSFNLWLIITIFAITMVAEFGLSIPYLLETIWLLTGYHTIGGDISPVSVVAFCTISLIGREIGAVALYKIAGYGRGPLARLFYKITDDRPDGKLTTGRFKRYIMLPAAKFVGKHFVPRAHNRSSGKTHQSNFGSRFIRPSAWNIALGRFAWLKIPITVTMGISRKPLALLAGVALFSLTWDGLYIMLGIFGAGSKINPLFMLAGTLSTLILINTSIYLVRRFLSARRLAGAGN